MQGNSSDRLTSQLKLEYIAAAIYGDIRIKPILFPIP